MSDDINRRLQEELHAVDLDNQYSVEEVLRENEAGRTEKVRSADGTVFVRKYLRRGYAQANEYAVLFGLQGSGAPFPRIITLYELADFQVVIMEYLDGPTLQECVERYRPYLPQPAVQITLGICEAVQILHTRGSSPIIHRDIKPANVILQDGRVKLIDFGIARTWKAGEQHDTEYLGTRGYAAPEQFGYSQTDVRTDIYACGATLYFLLTGEQFDAHRREALEHAPGGGQVALTRVLPVVPFDLARIICRCTEFSPDGRYQSAAELIAALQDALRVLTPAPVPAPMPASAAPVPVLATPVPAAPQTSEPLLVAAVESEAAKAPLSTPQSALAGEGKTAAAPRKRSKWIWAKDIIFAVIFWPFLIYGSIIPFTDYFWIYQKYGLLQFMLYAFGFWIIVELLILPCYLLFTNPFGVLDHIRFFAKNRKRRIALIAAAFLGLALICALPAASLQSPRIQADIDARATGQSTQNH
ncbi:MAG: protein kinase [Coriobacteriia bacterium]|nr:protein kinase [Coriobacteriia bacterium]